MVRGRLRSWHPDDEPPSNPEHFGVRCSAWIGTDADDRVDGFFFLWCSPSWLAEYLEEVPASLGFRTETELFGNGLVLSRRFDEEAMTRSLAAACDVEAQDWATLARRIARRLPWEFGAEADGAEDRGETWPK